MTIRRLLNDAGRQLLVRRSLSLGVFIAIYGAIFSVAFPGVFLSFYNISSMLLNMSSKLMIVLGMTVLLIGGEVDLSVGWNMGLCGVIYALMMTKGGLPLGVAVALTVVIAMLSGLLIGIIVAYLRVNSFIATLGAGLIYYGLEFNISGGQSVAHLGPNATAIGMVKVLGLQAPIWYAAVLMIVFLYLMGRTRVFRQYFYIGFNREAARLSGIPVAEMKIIGFVISSTLAGFAGIVSAAEYANAMLLVGQNAALNSIMAAMVGGVSFTGGTGTMAGAVLGTFLIALINNSFVIGNVNSFLQPIVIGLILLGVVILDARLSRTSIGGMSKGESSVKSQDVATQKEKREGGNAVIPTDRRPSTK